MTYLLAVVGIAVVLVSAPLQAAPCAGFTDVEDTSPFCASVEWMKNQGITLGCGTGSTYCPNDPVSRVAMAAFLKRFADAGTGQVYSYSTVPTCPVTNQCLVTFPPVPAGKRLVLTNVTAFFRNTTVASFLAVSKNTTSIPMVVFPMTPFGAAYYGTVLSTNQAVELVFEAGESPVVSLGSSGSINVNTGNRLGVTGYLVTDVP